MDTGASGTAVGMGGTTGIGAGGATGAGTATGCGGGAPVSLARSSFSIAASSAPLGPPRRLFQVPSLPRFLLLLWIRSSHGRPALSTPLPSVASPSSSSSPVIAGGIVTGGSAVGVGATALGTDGIGVGAAVPVPVGVEAAFPVRVRRSSESPSETDSSTLAMVAPFWTAAAMTALIALIDPSSMNLACIVRFSVVSGDSIHTIGVDCKQNFPHGNWHKPENES